MCDLYAGPFRWQITQGQKKKIGPLPPRRTRWIWMWISGMGCLEAQTRGVRERGRPVVRLRLHQRAAEWAVCEALYKYRGRQVIFMWGRGSATCSSCWHCRCGFWLGLLIDPDRRLCCIYILLSASAVFLIDRCLQDKVQEYNNIQDLAIFSLSLSTDVFRMISARVE